MATVTEQRATLDDLYKVEGKAELVNGRMIPMPSGEVPGVVAGEIFVRLHAYAKKKGNGMAYTDGVGYAVPELPSGRESFSPDASFRAGPRSTSGMRFIDGVPTFAAEVRSENDYGPAAEADMAAKRADYFTAGTQVVWDVDPVARCVHVYRAAAPAQPQTFRPGDTAEAEPAVPGWRMKVDDLFAGP